MAAERGELTSKVPAIAPGFRIVVRMAARARHGAGRTRVDASRGSVAFLPQRAALTAH